MEYVIYLMCAIGMFAGIYTTKWDTEISNLDKVGVSVTAAFLWPVFLIWMLVEHVHK